MATKDTKSKSGESNGKGEAATSSGIGNEGDVEDLGHNSFKTRLVNEDEKAENGTSYPECVVCLQSYYHPVKLPCGHIFCFLCVKGVAARSRRCALCRAELPADYFDHPVVVKLNSQQPQSIETIAKPANRQTDTSMYKWYYEGRNGWWQYEERASVQLEEAFINEDQSTELVVAGFVYIVDIKDMVQYRKNYPTRRRRVKRDKANADKKGVAGLKSSAQAEATSNVEPGSSDGNLEKGEAVVEGRQRAEDEVDLVAAKLDRTL